MSFLAFFRPISFRSVGNFLPDDPAFVCNAE